MNACFQLLACVKITKLKSTNSNQSKVYAELRASKTDPRSAKKTTFYVGCRHKSQILPLCLQSSNRLHHRLHDAEALNILYK